jgi:TonB family protein
MRQTLLLLFVFLLTVPALAQSGRKAPAPKPTPARSPPEPGVLQLKKSSKPSLPEFFDGERIYTSKQVDQKARIIAKPTPGYTREARRHSTRGLVILRAILGADQIVKQIEVITGLPDGLSERAIDAARRIRFSPAMKDGKPVSVWVEIEYRFNIY